MGRLFAIGAHFGADKIITCITMDAMTRGQRLGLLVGAVFVLVNIVRWGGAAEFDAQFAFGVVSLVGLMLGFAVLTHWLLFAPTARVAVHSSLASPTLRQLAAVAMLASGVMFTLATAWDESWHRQFGVGNDFWWMPHVLLYSSFGICSLCSSLGLLFVALKGQGGIRDRLRAEPLVALQALVCGFLLVSAPSDLLWHEIYGLDISAWSLPHVTVMVGLSAVVLCAVTLALSNVSGRSWRTLSGFAMGEGLALWLCALALTMFLQFGTTEWEGVSKAKLESAVGSASAFWRRPEWLYIVMMLGITGFTGSFAQFALRRVGAATLMSLVVIVQRLLALIIFGGFGNRMSVVAQLLALLPLMALDLVALWRTRGTRAYVWSPSNALVSVVMVMPALLIGVSALMAYPRVNFETTPWMIVFGGLTWFAFTWAGALLGSSAANAPKLVAAQHPVTQRVTLAALSSVAALVVFAVVLAQPPR